MIESHPNGRSVYGEGLRSIACWGCGFESCREHECLCCVRCTVKDKRQSQDNQDKAVQIKCREQKKILAGKIFSAPIHTGLGVHISLLYNGYRVIPRVKPAGAWL